MDYRTSVDFCLDALGGKWKVLIIAQLSRISAEAVNGTRLTDLMEQIPGLGRRVLIRELRELEIAEVVTRNDFDEKPPRVEYRLTAHGRALEPIIASMHEWGMARIERLAMELAAKDKDDRAWLISAENWDEAEQKLANLDPEILAELEQKGESLKLAKRSKELVHKLGKSPKD